MNGLQIPYRDVTRDQALTRLDFPTQTMPLFPMDYTAAWQLTDFSSWSGAKMYLMALYDNVLFGEADRIATRIAALAHDATMRDEDEPSPPQTVIDESTRLIRAVVNHIVGSVPPAQVAVFFGEVNVTWKSGSHVIRLAFFPNRPSVLQIGSLAMPVGSYQSQSNPTPQLVAERLSHFITQNDPEDSPFPG